MAEQKVRRIVSKRFTVGKMKLKYKRLHDQSYETVCITEVLNDLAHLEWDRRLPSSEL